MSKLKEWPGVLDTTAAACCTPLTEQVLPADKDRDLATAFKALGDPVRLQLLSQIATAESGEIYVCDPTPAFDLTSPTISHHLKVLREAGLIDCERRGTWGHYWAAPERMAALLRHRPGNRRRPLSLHTSRPYAVALVCKPHEVPP